MKKIITIALLIASVLFFASCQKEHAYNQKVTYYPLLTLQGDETVFLALGETYQEPGFTAIMSGKDVSDQVVIIDNIDNTKVGAYGVSYSLVNEDGFSSESVRTIYVYDPAVTIDISGVYEGVADTYRIYWPASKTDYPGYIVNIEKMAPGIFAVDDCFAGYYSQMKGYGEGYNMNGVIAVDASNNITLLDSYVAGWGDGLDTLTGTVNADGKLSLYAEYAESMEFDMTLKLQ